MLFFRSEEHVRRWCRDHAYEVAPVVTMEQLWQLSMAWYSSRLREDSRRPPPEEIREIFRRVGLTGVHWQLT